MRPPEFWRSDNGLARLLEPIGQIVGAVTARRIARTIPRHVGVPVICVGNLTTGGTGKTPVAAALVDRLAARGLSPAVLLRGYGGRLEGPVKVDPAVHGVEEVGDEALLHARRGAVWVGRDRARAADQAVRAGATVLVMDDGHQHPGLAKDLSLVVIDGEAAFGNGRVVPAGPLREPVAAGLARAQAVVIVGNDRTNLAGRLAAHLPVLRAQLVPGPEHRALKGQRVVAFAGIGDPEKFFRALSALGARVVARHPFDDHYMFETADIQPILDEAYAVDALPVTTEKDAVRLPRDQAQQVNVLSIEAQFEDDAILDGLLDRALGGRA